MRDRVKNIIEEFEMMPEWLDRYNYLIELADTLQPFDNSKKTSENLISGCQSRVWISTTLLDDGRMIIEADSDAIIVKGIIALLVEALSGLTPTEIKEEDFEFLKQIGLFENLSPTRAGGLEAMIRRIQTNAQNAL